MATDTAAPSVTRTKTVKPEPLSPLTLRCEQTTPNNPSHVKEVSTLSGFVRSIDTEAQFSS